MIAGGVWSLPVQMVSEIAVCQGIPRQPKAPTNRFFDTMKSAGAESTCGSFYVSNQYAERIIATSRAGPMVLSDCRTKERIGSRPCRATSRAGPKVLSDCRSEERISCRSYRPRNFSAPVGQASTHLWQLTQSAMVAGSRNSGLTTVVKPRPTRPRMPF